jgi:hypothetical protein
LIIAVCVVVAAAAILIAINYKPDGNQDDGNQEGLNSFVELQVGKYVRQDKLGTDSTYPDFWYGYNLSKLTEDSEDENIEDAEEQIIETEAVCYYAEQKGITISDEEIQENIDSLISDGKDADNYEEIKTACDSAGTTYEELINKNKSYYIKQMYVDKVYSEEYSKYYEDSSRVTAEEYDDEVLDWDSEWDDIKDQIVENFEKTKRYSELKKALAIDREIIQAETDDAFGKDIKLGWYARLAEE